MIRNGPKFDGGHTLVEVAVSVFVASLFFCGLVSVYAFGVKQFNSMASRMQMITEGGIVMRQLGDAIRSANIVYVVESSDPNRSRLHVTVPDALRRNTGYGTIEYYTDTGDHTVRLNDRRVGENNMRVLFLPKTRINQPGGWRYPFQVTKMHFQYADDDQDFYDNIGADYMVKIDMVLEDTLGNAVKLTSTHSRLN